MVGVADTHAGALLGLCSPHTRLVKFDAFGQRYHLAPELTETQQWLWECYIEDISKVKSLADGDPIILMHVGDETDGDKYKDQQVMTQSGAQLFIAAANFKPWYELSNLQAVRLFSGTSAHNFGEDSSTINVVDKLKEKYPGVDTGMVQHGLIEVDTVDFDIAHHGPTPGTRRYTEGRQLTYYTESLMQAALENWDTPPDVMMRGHYHSLCWQTVRKRCSHGIYETEAVILPAYCGLSEHGRQMTRSTASLHCGLVAFEIVDGELANVHPYYRSVDLRTKEVL